MKNDDARISVLVGRKPDGLVDFSMFHSTSKNRYLSTHNEKRDLNQRLLFLYEQKQKKKSREEEHKINSM